jgi:hypothetical protein
MRVRHRRFRPGTASRCGWRSLGGRELRVDGEELDLLRDKSNEGRQRGHRG